MAQPNHLKSALRSRLRAERAALDEAAWQQASAAICDRLLALPPIASAHNVALFWPLLRRREPDLRQLDSALRASDKHLYYPNMRGPSDSTPGSLEPRVDSAWGFRATASADDLHAVGGLYEPALSCPAAYPGDLAVVVAPCLALDDAGYRLGYGAGFYDRVLLRFAPPAFVVGVCFASERQRALPHEVHDRAVDWIVTDAESRAAQTTS